MRPFELDDADRAAYHAAASIASNFLVTLEAAAEEVAAGAGLAAGRGARAAGAARAHAPSRTGPRSARSGALTGPGRPWRRGDRRAPARCGRPRSRRPCCRCSTSWWSARAPSLPGACRHEDRAHRRRAARGSRPGTTAGRSIGLVPTMGYFHEGHLSLMRRARADCDVRGGVAVREPGPVRRRRGPRRLPARRAPRRRARRGRGAWTCCSRRRSRRSIPTGFDDARSGGRSQRRARRRRARPATSTASRPSSPSSSTWSARTWRTSARRTPSRRS